MPALTRTIVVAVILLMSAGAAQAQSKDLVFSTGDDRLEIPAAAIDRVSAGYGRVRGHYLELKLGRKATRDFADFTRKHNGRQVSTSVGDLVVSKGVRIAEAITSGELVLTGIPVDVVDRAHKALRARMSEKPKGGGKGKARGKRKVR